MHKRKLFTIGLLATGLLFTACNDDDDDDIDPVLGPSLGVTELNTNTSGGGELTITEGDNLQFAIAADEGAEDMDEFTISVTGVNSPSDIPVSSEGNVFDQGVYSLNGSEEEMFRDTVVFNAAGTAVGVTNYTFLVNDDNGASSSVSFDVTVEASANLVTSTFSWNRVGSNEATGLDQFGLAWENNLFIGGDVFAIVTTDEATTFVELTEDDWDNIDNSGDLTIAIEDAVTAGATIPESGYSEVSAEQDADYNDYLGVIYQGEPYILNIQNGVVFVNGTGQADITISGEYKN